VESLDVVLAEYFIVFQCTVSSPTICNLENLHLWIKKILWYLLKLHNDGSSLFLSGTLYSHWHILAEVTVKLHLAIHQQGCGKEKNFKIDMPNTGPTSSYFSWRTCCLPIYMNWFSKYCYWGLFIQLPWHSSLPTTFIPPFNSCQRHLSSYIVDQNDFNYLHPNDYFRKSILPLFSS